MAIIMAQRMTVAVFFKTSRRSFAATALESEGISEEARELAMARGTCTRSRYLLL